MTLMYTYPQWTILQDATPLSKKKNKTSLSPSTTNSIINKEKKDRALKNEPTVSSFTNKATTVRILPPTYLKSSITWKTEKDLLGIMVEFHSLLCFIISSSLWGRTELDTTEAT